MDWICESCLASLHRCETEHGCCETCIHVRVGEEVLC